MFERYTEKARRTIFFARYEASQFGSPYIEAEHLLLGMMREDKALFQHLLPGAGQHIRVLEEIRSRSTVGDPTSTSVDIPLSPAVKRALAYAAEESARHNSNRIDTAHLLLGLLREESLASAILSQHGVTQESVRAELVRPPIEPEPGTQVSALVISILQSHFGRIAARLTPEIEPATLFLFSNQQETET